LNFELKFTIFNLNF